MLVYTYHRQFAFHMCADRIHHPPHCFPSPCPLYIVSNLRVGFPSSTVRCMCRCVWHSKNVLCIRSCTTRQWSRLHCSVLQDVLPALLDLHVRAASQTERHVSKDQTTAHFSKEYMALLVQDVQHALASAGMGSAAQIASAAGLHCTPQSDTPIEQGSTSAKAAVTDAVQTAAQSAPLLEQGSVVSKHVCKPAVPIAAQRKLAVEPSSGNSKPASALAKPTTEQGSETSKHASTVPSASQNHLTTVSCELARQMDTSADMKPVVAVPTAQATVEACPHTDIAASQDVLVPGMQAAPKSRSGSVSKQVVSPAAKPGRRRRVLASMQATSPTAQSPTAGSGMQQRSQAASGADVELSRAPKGSARQHKSKATSGADAQMSNAPADTGMVAVSTGGTAAAQAQQGLLGAQQSMLKADSQETDVNITDVSTNSSTGSVLSCCTL